MKHFHVDTNRIKLHVVEVGDGPPVLFCHGFPDTWRGWRLQMEALAAAGYRAIAVDMRGYGESSAPWEPEVYTPFHTVGDLVGFLDTLGLASVIIVGHDFGASVAWHAALMRPDRFSAVFGMSVPYLPRGETSYLETFRAQGRTDFYMFSQMRAEADEAWADASITYPSFLYWSSAAPPPQDRWSPFDARPMYRKAPIAIPPWADAEDINYAIAEFKRTGFHGGLNYYRAIQAGFDLSAPFKGAIIRQPSFFLMGEADGLNEVRSVTTEGLRAVLPGLREHLRLPDVGHWPQREASAETNQALLGFLNSLV